ncbi:MAG: hypothetical protein M1820_001570 [Bogoriella megaspora]|nr:MAG: hypothetical protein M1820_001570 [Bogoriella megaspora]
MKFGKEYQEALAQGGFPAHWVYSAISYGQLKKCIKKVRAELLDIGLDANTLNHLLQACTLESGQKAEGSAEKSFEYRFSPEISAKDAPKKQSDKSFSTTEIPHGFRPKLLFAVDEQTGEPLDATLAPGTKDYLHQLAITQRLTDVRITELVEPSIPIDDEASASDQDSDVCSPPASSRMVRMVEVPLASDTVFFETLRSELTNLEHIQQDQKERMSSEIKIMAKSLCKSIEPARSFSRDKSDLAVWREIFQVYIESEIFFSTHENDKHTRNSHQIQESLQKFNNEIQKRNLESRLKRKDSKIALHQFLSLNVDLFKNQRFQEIESKAITKILKKFDKRTSLGISRNPLPLTLSSTTLSHTLPLRICDLISSQLLTLVPQVADYTCPVCLSLAWRPVRLKCNHIFCIRCLIVMQRNKDDHCPMCREKAVLAADSDNIDQTMMAFLKRWFPSEVKAKHEENVRAAGVDEYGEEFYSEKCVVM